MSTHRLRVVEAVFVSYEATLADHEAIGSDHPSGLTIAGGIDIESSVNGFDEHTHLTCTCGEEFTGVGAWEEGVSHLEAITKRSNGESVSDPVSLEYERALSLLKDVVKVRADRQLITLQTDTESPTESEQNPKDADRVHPASLD